MIAPFPVIDELVPHAASMILIDALTAWAPGEATCSLTLRDRAPFVKDGRVESVVSIEYMAQAVAACLGYEALRGGNGVRVGMIIACKRFAAHLPWFAVDDALTIEVKCIRGNDTLSHFDCRVLRDGALASEAVLTLYHAEKPPADMA